MKKVAFNTKQTATDVDYREVGEYDIIIATDKDSDPVGIVLQGNSAEGFIIRRGTISPWQITIGAPKFDKLSDFLRYHALDYDFYIF